MIVTVNTAPAAAVELIALSRLGVARENVRRTDRRGGIEGLAESIAAEGLLQNLTAFQTEAGRYRVVAGGRRLAALRMLARAGRWSGPVPVRVLPCASAAHRVSLTENVMRQALHPADAFEAFAGLIAEGLDSIEVARRFGVSVRHVEQRMKLAAVAPALVRAYRAGDMTLDQLTAFAVVDDQARQLAVWTGRNGRRDLSPRGIRSALLSEHVPATDKLARLVGVEAYKAAGGTVIRDLFGDAELGGDETGTWLTDSALLQRLASERIGAEVEAIKAEGWAWAEVTDGLSYSGFHAYERVHPGPESYTPADMARAGCVVALAHDGRLRVERGLIRPEDARRERKQARAVAMAARIKGGGAIAEAPSPALSDALVEALTAERTAALQVEVMRRPDLALAGVAHALALPVFYAHAWRAASSFEIRATPPALASWIEASDDSPALQAMEQAFRGWAEQLPGEAGDLWGWLTGQDRETVTALLAFLAARSVNAVRQRHDAGSARLDHADQLARSAALDMTAWWSADAAFLARLNKGQIAKAVAEGASPELASPLAKLPKAQAVDRAAQALEGRGWLPAPLRTGEARSEDQGEVETEAEIHEAEGMALAA